METRAHHIIIGLFVLVGVFAAAAFALWLNQYAADGEYSDYEVVFSEPVTGLSRGADVAYNGIRVGEVRDLRIDETAFDNAIARIRVRADLPVQTDTVARLQFQGLTGVAFIQLAGGSREARDLREAQGVPVPRIRAETSGLQRLFATGEDVMTSASGVMARVALLLSDDNRERVDEILANSATFSAMLVEQGPAIERITEDAAATLADLRQAAAQLNSTAQRLDSVIQPAETFMSEKLPEIGDEVAEAARTAAAVMQRIDAIVAAQEVPLQRFSEETLLEVDRAVTDLRLLLKTFDRIGERIEQDPAAYLLGRPTLPEYKPESRR